MKLSIGVLEPLLSSDGKQEKMPVVVIASLEGDIHDIGKNLVALMLRNYGFEVIDLGKDVPKEKIIQAAKEHGAGIIGLSALMTTTVQEMRHVVELAHEEGLDSKIIIGGAVVTQDYADEIHADGYAKDAADTVRLAKRLLGLNEETQGTAMEMNDRTEQAEELWDDLPTDSQHETLWEAEGTELAVRQLMDQLKASEEKQQGLMKEQLLFTRIFAVSNCVLVLIVLIFVAGVLPRLTTALDKATESLVKVDGALDDFGKVFDNINSLVDSSSKAVEQTMDKVDQMDIESLNNAISDLNDVVAPMAEFFGRFR